MVGSAAPADNSRHDEEARQLLDGGAMGRQ
jgi:hypothetical protein